MGLLNKRNMAIGAVVVGIPALIVSWWLISPLFLDSEVNEAFPVAAADDQSGAEPASVTSEEPADSTATTAPTSTTDPTTEAAPVTLLTGEFRDADASHRGMGTATVYELDDGSRILRFENFEVTNGPDLHVYLVPAENAGDDVDINGYVDLGELKGNIGDQNYEIPPDVDIEVFGSVVIWCEPFSVLFSVAPLG